MILKMLYLLWNMAQRDRFGKNTEREFLWEHVEIDLIKDEKNKRKRVRLIPLVRQESVHAKPQHLPPNLTELATIWGKVSGGIQKRFFTLFRMVFVW